MFLAIRNNRTGDLRRDTGNIGKKIGACGIEKNTDIVDMGSSIDTLVESFMKSLLIDIVLITLSYPDTFRWNLDQFRQRIL